MEPSVMQAVVRTNMDMPCRFYKYRTICRCHPPPFELCSLCSASPYTSCRTLLFLWYVDLFLIDLTPQNEKAPVVFDKCFSFTSSVLLGYLMLILAISMPPWRKRRNLMRRSFSSTSKTECNSRSQSVGCLHHLSDQVVGTVREAERAICYAVYLFQKRVV